MYNVTLNVNEIFLQIDLLEPTPYHCVKSAKYGIFSGPYFPAFGLNTERYYGPENTPYLDTFHAVLQNKHARYLTPIIFNDSLK